MEFRILGALEVVDADGRVVEVRGGKLRTILALLVLRAGRPVSFDELADAAWPGSPPAGAANALQAQVSKLRRLLPGMTVESRDGGYALQIDPRNIDATLFEEAMELGRRRRDEGRAADAAMAFRSGLDLWRGPALADFAYDDFAQSERARLDELRVAAMEDAIDADLAAGASGGVVAEIEALLGTQPLRERVWAQLMLALYRSGRQADALRAFQRARTVLGDELGLEPGPSLRELERRILEHDPALGAVASATSAPPSNIHPEMSAFVGRNDAVLELAEAIEARRLVTVVGPGGVGKTRLAIETAQVLNDRFQGGTWLVELGPEQGTRAVVNAFARTFGERLGRTGAVPDAEWLAGGLGQTELVVLLDNCEHVLTEAAATVAALLRACPNVRVLATSREPLGLPGERIRRLGPLERGAAAQLFTARAVDADDTFRVTDDDGAAIEAICHHVDGLPLAIELAAARTRTFTVQQLEGLLRERLSLLDASGAARPARQQTMDAAVGWSFDLLPDDERRLFARLSVFAGGFTLHAASTVCSSAAVPGDHVPVLLARLVDRSLLTVNVRGSAQRFRLLRPVAEHARARLAEFGEVAELRRRHMQWLADDTAEVTAQLRGPGAIECAQRLLTELPNLVRAAQWALDEGDALDALRIAVHLGWYAFVSANVQNDEQLLVELLRRAEDTPPALRCRAQMWAGLLSIGRTRRRTWAMDAVDVARTASVAAVASLEVDGVSLTVDSIAAARRSGDPGLLLEALTIGSLHLAAIGSHPDTLRALNVEARALALETGDRWSLAFVGALDGLAAYVAGDLGTSIEQLGAAVDGLRELGDLGTAALFLVSYSEVAELVGDIAGAADTITTALEVGTAAGFRSAVILRAVACWLRGRNGEVETALELGRQVVASAQQPFNLVVRAQALFALGVAETLAGEYDDAEPHLREALAIHQRLGMDRETAMDHRHVGELLRLRDDVPSAIEHHRKAVLLATQVGLPWTVMLTARSLAAALVLTQPALAARLVGLVTAISTTFHYFPTPDELALDDHVLATATASLGAPAVARERIVGATMDLDDLPALVRNVPR